MTAEFAKLLQTCTPIQNLQAHALSEAQRDGWGPEETARAIIEDGVRHEWVLFARTTCPACCGIGHATESCPTALLLDRLQASSNDARRVLRRARNDIAAEIRGRGN